MPGRPVVEPGCQVRFGGRTWTVVALGGGQVRLAGEDGEVAAALLSLLFADAGFEVLDAPGVPGVPPLGLLESLPEAVRERALVWERHVGEVETGRPAGPGAAGPPPRAEYDPQTRTLAQREEAKAAELSAASLAASVVTVRRMRARYRREGVWGLVDHRVTRPRTTAPEPSSAPADAPRPRCGLPYERLLSVDARLEGAAARPVITPQTVVVDQGKVFVSSSFIAACESLGISVQPAPPGNGPAKGHVERTFSSINSLFVQHVAAYTASSTGERGKGAEGEAVWTLAQLDDLLQEWIICGWQEREHDGLRHPVDAPMRAVA